MIQELIKTEDFASAMLKVHCDEQLKLRPRDAYIHYLLGRHYQATQIWDSAIFHYRMAILIRSDQLGTWQGLHNSYVAKYGEKSGVEHFSKFINQEISLSENTSDIDNDMLLIRITESKYVDSFVSEGQGRFNPTKNYRRPKEEGPWYDLDENRPQKIIDVDDIRLTGAHIKKLEFNIGGLYRILCFSSVTRANVKDFIENYQPEKFQADKDKVYSAIVIKSPKKFIEQVVSLHPKMEFGSVNYLPAGVVQRANAIFSPFVKDIEYYSEYEFRLATQYAGNSPQLDDAVPLDLGNLDEFVTVIDPDELFDFIEDYYP